MGELKLAVASSDTPYAFLQDSSAARGGHEGVQVS